MLDESQADARKDRHETWENPDFRTPSFSVRDHDDYQNRPVYLIEVRCRANPFMARAKMKPETSEVPKSEPNFIDWQSFSYLTAEKSEQYRAIVNVFAAAKSEFKLHLRPAEVRSALPDTEVSMEISEVESALQSLEGWGNLQSYQDNSDVTSLADYYRKRLLYQMTAAGEAAHASTETFVQRLQQQAKLDARALDRIADGAGQLQRLVEMLANDSSKADAAVVLTTMRGVSQDANELTSRAQSFFRWLHEQTESDRADLKSFLEYKERLIQYLQEFVTQLISQGAVIAKRLNTIPDRQFTQLARLAAEEEVGQPRAGEESEHETWLVDTALRWRQSLLGLRSWFSRSGGSSAQLDQLRAAARAAIPRLLQLASQMNERQSGRSDRVTDLRELAVRFLSCRDDREAHRLYRASFALSSSRHLRVDQTTIEYRDQHPTSNRTRWLDAEPIEFSPQLRETGRQPTAASNRRVVNRTLQRAQVKRRLSLDTGRKNSARETLLALGRRRLSDIGEMDNDSFHLLLELIGQAVAKPMGRNSILSASQTGAIRAFSRDRNLRIETWPVTFEHSEIENPPSQQQSVVGRDQSSKFVSARGEGESQGSRKGQRIARLNSKFGTLMLPDRWVEVTRV